MLECERFLVGNNEETNSKEQGCNEDDNRIKLTKK